VVTYDGELCYDVGITMWSNKSRPGGIGAVDRTGGSVLFYPVCVDLGPVRCLGPLDLLNNAPHLAGRVRSSDCEALSPVWAGF